MIRKILFIALLVYSVTMTYVSRGYEQVNDKLNRVNDTLLRSCLSSKQGIIEGEAYK